MRRRVCTIGIAWMLLPALTALSSGTPQGEPAPGAEITNSVGMKLVYIPPGKFLMGSPKDEPGRFDDEAPHEVEITTGFYLGRYEVTQAEYEKVTGKNPSAFKGPKLPVETVAWKDAKDFCRLLSVQEGKGGKEGKDGTGYRLPTEAEWELACRAGTKSPYHLGETISPEKANYDNPRKNGPVDVGTYAPNARGLHDMHGNVWEWCEDSYVPDYGKIAAKQDPKGPLNGGRRIVRGGGWGSDPRYCRSAARMSHEGGQYPNIGFRVVLNFVK